MTKKYYYLVHCNHCENEFILDKEPFLNDKFIFKYCPICDCVYYNGSDYEIIKFYNKVSCRNCKYGFIYSDKFNECNLECRKRAPYKYDDRYYPTVIFHNKNDHYCGEFEPRDLSKIVGEK